MITYVFIPCVFQVSLPEECTVPEQFVLARLKITLLALKYKGEKAHREAAVKHDAIMGLASDIHGMNNAISPEYLRSYRADNDGRDGITNESNSQPLYRMTSMTDRAAFLTTGHNASQMQKDSRTTILDAIWGYKLAELIRILDMKKSSFYGTQVTCNALENPTMSGDSNTKNESSSKSTSDRNKEREQIRNQFNPSVKQPDALYKWGFTCTHVSNLLCDPAAVNSVTREPLAMYLTHLSPPNEKSENDAKGVLNKYSKRSSAFSDVCNDAVKKVLLTDKDKRKDTADMYCALCDANFIDHKKSTSVRCCMCCMLGICFGNVKDNTRGISEMKSKDCVQMLTLPKQSRGCGTIDYSVRVMEYNSTVNAFAGMALLHNAPDGFGIKKRREQSRKKNNQKCTVVQQEKSVSEQGEKGATNAQTEGESETKQAKDAGKYSQKMLDIGKTNREGVSVQQLIEDICATHPCSLHAETRQNINDKPEGDSLRLKMTESVNMFRNASRKNYNVKAKPITETMGSFTFDCNQAMKGVKLYSSRLDDNEEVAGLYKTDPKVIVNETDVHMDVDNNEHEAGARDCKRTIESDQESSGSEGDINVGELLRHRHKKRKKLGHAAKKDESNVGDTTKQLSDEYIQSKGKETSRQIVRFAVALVAHALTGKNKDVRRKEEVSCCYRDVLKLSETNVTINGENVKRTILNTTREVVFGYTGNGKEDDKDMKVNTSVVSQLLAKHIQGLAKYVRDVESYICGILGMEGSVKKHTLLTNVEQKALRPNYIMKAIMNPCTAFSPVQKLSEQHQTAAIVMSMTRAREFLHGGRDEITPQTIPDCFQHSLYTPWCKKINVDSQETYPKISCDHDELVYQLKNAKDATENAKPVTKRRAMYGPLHMNVQLEAYPFEERKDTSDDNVNSVEDTNTESLAAAKSRTDDISGVTSAFFDTEGLVVKDYYSKEDVPGSNMSPFTDETVSQYGKLKTHTELFTEWKKSTVNLASIGVQSGNELHRRKLLAELDAYISSKNDRNVPWVIHDLVDKINVISNAVTSSVKKTIKNMTFAEKLHKVVGDNIGKEVVRDRVLRKKILLTSIPTSSLLQLLLVLARGAELYGSPLRQTRGCNVQMITDYDLVTIITAMSLYIRTHSQMTDPKAAEHYTDEFRKLKTLDMMIATPAFGYGNVMTFEKTSRSPQRFGCSVMTTNTRVNVALGQNSGQNLNVSLRCYGRFDRLSMMEWFSGCRFGKQEKSISIMISPMVYFNNTYKPISNEDTVEMIMDRGVQSIVEAVESKRLSMHTVIEYLLERIGISDPKIEEEDITKLIEFIGENVFKIESEDDNAWIVLSTKMSKVLRGENDDESEYEDIDETDYASWLMENETNELE